MVVAALVAETAEAVAAVLVAVEAVAPAADVLLVAVAPLAAAVVVEVAAVVAVFVDDDDKFSAAVTAVEAGPAVVLVPSESAVAVDGVAAAVEK